MDTERAQTLYSKQVTPFLRYRIGGQLASRISTYILKSDVSRFNNARDAFHHLLTETLNFQIGEYAVLKLIFDNTELEQFEPKFLTVFDNSQDEVEESSFSDIFDKLIASYMEDILGKELVETVKNVFLKSVATMPDQPTDVRFYIGMQAIYHFIPDVWGEVEFAEKVKDLSRLLPDDAAETKQGTTATIDFEELVEKIIISDLVDIMGRGHALETVIDAAKEKTVGIFYNEHDRFATFVNNILEDNFIVRMFDSYWIDERRKKWLDEIQLVLNP